MTSSVEEETASVYNKLQIVSTDFQFRNTNLKKRIDEINPYIAQSDF